MSIAQADLVSLIKQGEGPKLEFKRDDVRPESLAKEIVAFANMNGGQVLLGVEDDGGISGIKRKNLQEWLLDVVIGRYISPHILPDYQEVEVKGGAVAVIEVPMGTAKPYAVKRGERSDVYVRYGNICRLADRTRMIRLFATGGHLSVERFPVHGSKLDELSELRYQHYLSQLLRMRGEINEELLTSQDIMVGKPGERVCSYFAYALFALKPGVRLPQAPVRVVVFPGQDKDYELLLDEVLDAPYVELRTDFGATEPAIQERVIHALKPFISRDKMVNRVRQREWDYPPNAVEEAVINGLIHRDWTNQNQVRVEAYSDRLEILSPGALPNNLTIDKIKSGRQQARNPEIVKVFRAYGYLEGLGMGIRHKIIPLCLERNGREPDFEATEDDFKVIMYKHGK